MPSEQSGTLRPPAVPSIGAYLSRLTKLQRRALAYLLMQGEGGASDYWFYDYGGGPHGWRTMDSLERRGLVRKVEWNEAGDESGWIRELTHDGLLLAREQESRV